MLSYTLRWPACAARQASVAQSFFHILVLLCVEQMQAKKEQGSTLLRATHPSLIHAMDIALVYACHVNLKEILISHTAMSERSFRRHFHSKAGMTWPDWITQAHLFHAVTSLAEDLRVLDGAAEVGDVLLSAFAKAFTNLIGLSPIHFRNTQKEENSRNFSVSRCFPRQAS